jgi:hypothetical protein
VNDLEISDDGPPAVAAAAKPADLVEVAVDKNSTVVFPALLMSTIAELGAFLPGEQSGRGPTGPGERFDSS